MRPAGKWRYRLELIGHQPDPVVVVEAPNPDAGWYRARRFFDRAYYHRIRRRKTFFCRISYDGPAERRSA